MKIMVGAVLVILLTGCTSVGVSGSTGSSGNTRATIGVGSGVRF
ncbi:hypothetical protein ACQ86O_20655 [Serratia sp. L9]